ncbi:N-acetylmuramoyl-L-alanine amidase [Shimia aestuarii]|uniref:N-acetylmuramoyl-L-alanine amidase n=1 Tax=Shimia aestuarii TaxID=254406 RepID=UPI001FB44CB5|nr:N-acetylmuramoyl-L-alanine amidase [Shimia aestuarii]
MSRIIAVICALVWAFAAPGQAQELSGLARVEAAKSGFSEGWRGSVTFRLGLSQGVPWRVFQLEAPRRLVLDFREVDWRGVTPETFGAAEGIGAVQFGQFRPGWSRMVVELTEALAVETAALAVDEISGAAQLELVLDPVSAEDYAALAGAPRDPRWDLPEPALPMTGAREARPDWAPVVIVIDPGHGGIDPGAERDDVNEKTLMLTFARELRDTLRRTGAFEVVLTRDEDVFVSLERRVSIAHEVGADVFISLHADALRHGHATGATVYTLSEEASDKASEILAERHDRADILAGIDLSQADDEVANVLLDLARLETQPRTELFARMLVKQIEESTGSTNKKPLRHAGFSVLKAADVPSVLLEVGFLSSEEDLARLTDPNWRALMAGGIRDALQLWVQEDEEMRALLRQ